MNNAEKIIAKAESYAAVMHCVNIFSASSEQDWNNGITYYIFGDDSVIMDEGGIVSAHDNIQHAKSIPK